MSEKIDFRRIANDPRFENLARLDHSILSNWNPNPFQKEVGAAVLYGGKRRIFVEVGRKGGKTEICSYLCWMLGNMIQRGQIYYFGALAKAVREFLWKPRRLHNFGASEYIVKSHETDMRLTFPTGTYVKLDGADEFRAAKGFNPDVVICDEFADYSSDFWTAMSPNFAAKDAIVICVSTPPWQLEESPGEPVLFVRLADLWKKRMMEADKKGVWSKFAYFNYTSFVNKENLPPNYLEAERQDLIELGQEDLWQREYLAMRVVGGGRRMIGTYERDRHQKPFGWMMDRIRKSPDDFHYHVGVDPGNSSVFGVLIAAINPYTKEIYFLDEIYERREDETMAYSIQPRITAIEKEIYPYDGDPWIRTYDEAEKWWYLDALHHFGVTYCPTEKSQNAIEAGLSVLRTAFRYDLGYVSDRCINFDYELLNWRKTKTGQVQRTNDHLIDPSRYIIHAEDYFITKEFKTEREGLHIREKRHILAQDTPQGVENPDDFFQDIFEDMLSSEEYDKKWEHQLRY